jgi:hypothetical protein
VSRIVSLGVSVEACSGGVFETEEPGTIGLRGMLATDAGMSASGRKTGRDCVGLNRC